MKDTLLPQDEVRIRLNLQEGIRRLGEVIHRFKSLSTPELYARCFGFMANSPELFAQHYLRTTIHDVPWQQCALLDMVRFLKQVRPEVQIPVVFADEASRTAFSQQSGGTLLISVHAKLEGSFYKCAVMVNKDFSAISAIGNLSSQQALYGLTRSAHIIQTTNASLVKLRRNLSAKKLVLGLVDYAFVDSETGEHPHRLSLNLFEFGIRLKVPMVGCAIELTNQGVVRVHAKPLVMQKSAVEVAQDFLAFARIHTASAKRVEIGDWNADKQKVEATFH